MDCDHLGVLQPGGDPRLPYHQVGDIVTLGVAQLAGQHELLDRHNAVQDLVAGLPTRPIAALPTRAIRR
jgi:hypothetical protein